MKRTKTDQTIRDQETQRGSSSQSRITEVLCPEGHRAIFICMSKFCTHSAMVCVEEECKCQKTHEHCSVKKLNSVLKKIEEKVKSFQPVIYQNELLMQEKIEHIQGLVERLKNLKSTIRQIIENQFCGLLPFQKKMFHALMTKKTDDLKGCNIFQLQNQMHKGLKYSVESQILKLREYWKKNYSCCKQLEQKMNYIGNYFKKGMFSKFSQRSNIVTIPKQVSYLTQDLFQDQIQSLDLLYRASENGFRIEKFKQTCGNIPHTLTLIHTDKGKKVGGYSPTQWNRANLVNDPLIKASLFSLTQKIKFQDLMTENSPNYGPFFKKSYNLYLVDKFFLVDQNNTKTSAISGFEKAQDGTLCEKNFLTKEWEVWKINFKKQI